MTQDTQYYQLLEDVLVRQSKEKDVLYDEVDHYKLMLVNRDAEIKELREQLIAANKGNETTRRKKEAWKEQYLKMASRCDALQAEMETERCSALDKEHDLLKTVTNHEAYKTLSKWYSEAVDDLCRVRALNLKLLRENIGLKNMLGK
jgi:hypothetical protein